MKKLSTLFLKDPNDLGRVINVVDPQNQWVFDGEGIPTRKFDGSAATIINGLLYKRYDAKRGKPAPEFGIPCQAPDPITGHWPHWVPCKRDNPADKYFFEAFDNIDPDYRYEGTYELCGEKVQGNPEKIEGHYLIRHGEVVLDDLIDISFDSLKDYLSIADIEGIVFHHKSDDRMCKIRKSDFGLIR